MYDLCTTITLNIQVYYIINFSPDSGLAESKTLTKKNIDKNNHNAEKETEKKFWSSSI